MNITNRTADFLSLGYKLLQWYDVNARDLPWRKIRDPYRVWICEIILQQTRVEQGKNHYLRFVEKFPDVKALAQANIDEVLLYWKGLGYYSRAINLHRAAQQIMDEFQGDFPTHFLSLQKLKGVGKYTAAAISSICFDEKVPAVDGNFYRVLSRVFADDFDISSSKAHAYFYELALRMMPDNSPGNFNQAIMDLGSEVCKPKNPKCDVCPLCEDCLAFVSKTPHAYPVKSKKVKTQELALQYYFVQHQDQFLIKQRDESFIWKKLFDFPEEIPDEYLKLGSEEEVISHKLTHKNLKIVITRLEIEDAKVFTNFALDHHYLVTNFEKSQRKSFPKPLENYLKKQFE